jgi:hypothetical protein
MRAPSFDPHVFSHFTHTGVFAGNLIATLTLAMLVVISIALVPLRSLLGGSLRCGASASSPWAFVL